MGKFKITALDHIVLNVGDIERALQFYTGVLGLAGERVEQFRAGKVGFPSVRIDDATIIDLFPRKTPDSHSVSEKVDGNLNHVCLVVDAGDFAGVIEDLTAKQIAIREGPVSRWGARGQGTSVYFLDPDGNEVEIRYY
jgi:catechol 2,3-dioxygenase-like lactoylglutathione lyase family enzyme